MWVAVRAVVLGEEERRLAEVELGGEGEHELARGCSCVGGREQDDGGWVAREGSFW